MANSELIGKYFKIPNYVYKMVKHRNNEFTNNGIISYEQLKKEKHIMDHSNSESKEYEEMGGKSYHLWLNNFLEVLRNKVENHKKNNDMAGFSNQYIKNHEKDVNNANPTEITRL